MGMPEREGGPADPAVRDAAWLDKKYVWHPFTQMKDWLAGEPIVIVSGEGVRLRDDRGREYYDGNSSMWVNIHGHRRPEINSAIKRQLDLIAHSTQLGLASPPAAELAVRLVALAPRGLARVFYSDDGSTAVEVAIKMAFQYWRHRGEPGRRLFVHLDLSYHGDTLGAVSVGGIDLYHAVFRPLLFETLTAPAPYCYRCSLGHGGPGGARRDASAGVASGAASCGLACAEALGAVLAAHAGGVAAVILEPLVMAAGGMITAPPGYLRRVRELCDRHGVLLIADEVATGFGRTGRMFACEHEGVTPDLMCLSKGLTGGYLPLAVTLATEEVFGAFLGEYHEVKTFFHGHSYTGNQLGCAAALASLDIFARDRVLESLPAKEELVARWLEGFRELRSVGDVRQRGLMVGIELVRDRGTGEPFRWEEAVGVRVCRRAAELGMITRPLGNVVVFMPPLASTAADLEAAVKTIAGSARSMGVTVEGV